LGLRGSATVRESAHDDRAGISHQAGAQWPARRRIELAEELVASVEGFATPEIEAAWDKEIAARVQDIRAGREEAIPAEEVMAEARRKLHEARRQSSDRRQQTR
jgi:putative addiction module component (TIGR02574 family)